MAAKNCTPIVDSPEDFYIKQFLKQKVSSIGLTLSTQGRHIEMLNVKKVDLTLIEKQIQD